MLSAKFHMCSLFMSQHHETGRNTLIYRGQYDDFCGLNKNAAIKYACFAIIYSQTRCQKHATNNVNASIPNFLTRNTEW